MKREFISDKDLYDYRLPEELIASKPAEKRDESRLFVFDTKAGSITFDIFRNISNYLPEKSLMVLNETKVVPARISLTKRTGGKVEILFLVDQWDPAGDTIEGMADRRLEVGEVLTLRIGQSDHSAPHAPLVAHPSSASEEIATDQPAASFEVIGQKENIFTFKIDLKEGDVLSFLNAHGKMPVPKYIKGVALSEDQLRDRYQTVFATDQRSIAAPTASLHFTPEVFERLKQKQVETAKISLNVGQGTFKPITEENIKSDSLHTEKYSISTASLALIQQAKKTGTPIIAVGTTTVRCLESFMRTSKPEGSTNIFIHPPFEFKAADHLITNFHLPNSSLMMLVEAFLQYKKSPKHLIDLYKKAIEEKFRFYSFGDSMLII